MKCISNMQPRLSARLALVCALPVVFSSVATAQNVGEVSGVVTDSSGTPVFGAIVEVAGSQLRTRTNERGEFLLTDLPAGMADIHFRRLGFGLVAQSARILPGKSLSPFHIILPTLPTTVKPVVVQAGRVEYSGRLAGYYERLHRHSNGTFIDRAQIDRAANKSLSQLISATPGITGMQLSTGGNAVRIRGMACRPLVWLDGVPLPAGEVNLDAFPVSTLQGIELYLGATNAPGGFAVMQGLSSCGTILLWSRGRDTERAETAQSRSIDVEELTASHEVFTADEVDTPAHLARQDLEVSYPPDLLASKISGTAVAEFVVAANGEIETGSIEVFSATNPSFADAVVQALGRARYVPAVKDGVTVRQIVQQPFRFSLDADSAETTAQR
jgi:TonB family protein